MSGTRRLRRWRWLLHSSVYYVYIGAAAAARRVAARGAWKKSLAWSRRSRFRETPRAFHQPWPLTAVELLATEKRRQAAEAETFSQQQPAAPLHDGTQSARGSLRLFSFNFQSNYTPLTLNKSGHVFLASFIRSLGSQKSC